MTELNLPYVAKVDVLVECTHTVSSACFIVVLIQSQPGNSRGLLFGWKIHDMVACKYPVLILQVDIFPDDSIISVYLLEWCFFSPHHSVAEQACKI